MTFDPKRYPANWKAIRAGVLVRAMGRCECAGECGRHSGACGAVNHHAHPETGSRVVLTIAHLWQGPCAECHARGFKCGDHEHLKAMCQACHLTYDLEQHQANRRRNRFELKAAADLFDGEHPVR